MNAKGALLVAPGVECRVVVALLLLRILRESLDHDSILLASQRIGGHLEDR